MDREDSLAPAYREVDGEDGLAPAYRELIRELEQHRQHFKAMLTVCRSFEGSPAGISRNNNNNNSNNKNNETSKERETPKRNVFNCKSLGEDKTDISSNQKTAGEETLEGYQDLREAKVEGDKSGFEVENHEESRDENRDNTNVQNQGLWKTFECESGNKLHKESHGENGKGANVQNRAPSKPHWGSFGLKSQDQREDKSRLDGVEDENEEGNSSVENQAMGLWSQTLREAGFLFLQQLIKHCNACSSQKLWLFGGILAALLMSAVFLLTRAVTNFFQTPQPCS